MVTCSTSIAVVYFDQRTGAPFADLNHVFDSKTIKSLVSRDKCFGILFLLTFRAEKGNFTLLSDGHNTIGHTFTT